MALSHQLRLLLPLCAHAAMATLVLSASLKLLDIRQFADDLKTWTLIPAPLHAPLSLAVPLVEATAALAWFLRLARPAMLTLALCLLAVLTAAYAAQATLVGPPKCGCFGSLFRYEHSVGLAWLLIARNLVLLTALLVGGSLILRRERAPTQPREPARPTPSLLRTTSPRRNPTAFSILELLIVIAIIALVVSLTIPSLARVREKAQQIKSMANLRSHSAVLSSYAGDWQDSLPHVSDPLATATILRGGGVTVSIPYFKLFNTWNVALADQYYSGDALPDAMNVPWKQPYPPTTFYYYGDCFIARPDYWNYSTRRSDTTQLRRTLLAEVAFPAAKGLVFEQGWLIGPTGLLEISRDARLSLVDGSARDNRYDQFLPPYVSGSSRPGGPPGGYDWGIPTMHTIDGVLGRDLP